jgi:hypothetical protein
MDQQDTLRVITALRNEARRLERMADAANPEPPAYQEGLREEVRAMDRLAAGIRNSGGVYTRDEVSTAANNGADMIGYSDELSMVVNAQMTRLDKPDAALDDVILANWQCEAEDFEKAGITGWATRELTEDEHQRAEAALVERMKEYLS